MEIEDDLSFYHFNVCQLCGTLENLLVCTGCRETWYCSKDHQLQHWNQHKSDCKEKSKCKASSSQNCKNFQSNNLSGGVCSEPTNQAKISCSVSTFLPRKTAQTITTGNSSNDTLSHGSDRNESIDNLPERSCILSKTNATKNKILNVDLCNGYKNVILLNQQQQLASEEGSNVQHFLVGRKISTEIKCTNACNFLQEKCQTEHKHPNKEAYLDVLRSRFDKFANYTAKCLYKYGICVLDKFLGDASGYKILKEAVFLRDNGLMRQGQLVSSRLTASKDIRGDMITWVGDNRDKRYENINFLVSCMDAVVRKCSFLLDGCTINERTKAMVACYPGSKTRYMRHVDNPNCDGRYITCIYYLNKDWNCKLDGGMLQIYPEGKDSIAGISPDFDRLLLFWSDRRNPHEVLPANKDRYAITVWYFEAEERAKAIQSFKGVPRDDGKSETFLKNDDLTL